jgi:DNA-3-methyladenine glycosylase II
MTNNPTTQFSIRPDGPFSLAAAAGFGFGPHTGRPTTAPASGVDSVMNLAFVTDDFRSHAFVSLRQGADGVVEGTMDSDAPAALVERQVSRILSLDSSGIEWAKVGDSDPVLGGMQHSFPGLRPVLFHSPYEAAAWSIISARRQRAQGTVVRNRIAEALGRVYGDGQDKLFAFPTPERLLELRQVQGLEETKVQRLHAVARAALAGELDPAVLLGMSTEDALAHIQKLPGIGPTYSMLILLRSTGATDAMTGIEPRLPTYLAHFYGLAAPATTEQIARIMNGWRPFRTWSAVLVRVAGDRLGLPLPPLPSSASRLRR